MAHGVLLGAEAELYYSGNEWERAEKSLAVKVQEVGGESSGNQAALDEI
jgi:hypothetical protein